MRTDPTTALRTFLLAALGAAAPACGSTTDTTATSSGGDGGVITLPDGAVVPTNAVCANPQPMLVGGKDTGFDQCAGGRIRRRSAMACPSLLPRASGGTCGAGIDSGISGGCQKDADCTAKPYGHCGPSGQLACACNYGCLSDQDCGTDQICLCGEPVGRCVSATCKDAASCSGGAQCADFDRSSGCGVTTFACTTPADKCFSDSDCSDGGGGMCLIESNATSRTCSRSACAIGRPFVVAGTARVAPHARRSDWLGDERPNLGGLDAATRASLAAHWREVAALEHGSIASFARFTLELLALGAPSDLVLDTQRAAADEARHARTAYAFATAYGDGSVGPGPLAIDGAIESPSWERFVERLVREGCVGETFGALEAAEAAARADDPVVRDALLLVAIEEAEHAALAWRALRFALAHGGARLSEIADASRDQAVEELRVSLDRARSSEQTAHASLERFGVLSPATRAELHARAALAILPACRSACAA